MKSWALIFLSSVITCLDFACAITVESSKPPFWTFSNAISRKELSRIEFQRFSSCIKTASKIDLPIKFTDELYAKVLNAAEQITLYSNWPRVWAFINQVQAYRNFGNLNVLLDRFFAQKEPNYKLEHVKDKELNFIIQVILALFQTLYAEYLKNVSAANFSHGSRRLN